MGILIVDPHDMLRAALKVLIGGQRDMHVVGEAASAEDAVCLAASVTPDVVTLDLCMPPGSGITVITRIRTASPGSRVLVLTMHEDLAYVRSALATGATGYVVKSAVDSELVNAIRAVYLGRKYVVTKATDQSVVSGADSLTVISDRERVAQFASESQKDADVYTVLHRRSG